MGILNGPIKLHSINIVPSDKALPHCRITHIDGKEVPMTEQNLTPEEADQKGVNPETGEPDNPDHGTYANPIDHDYNLENLENAEEPAVEEDDSSNTVNPEPVDGTAEGADAPFGYRG